MSAESASMKQPIRRLEIPISKFNDVAIPHHLDLLRRHKNNIKKFQRLRDWDKIQREQINASRLVKQLEQLLYEMDTLRAQVQDADIEKFDNLTAKSRSSTISAIREYLEMEFEPPPAVLEQPEAAEGEISMDNTEENIKFFEMQKENDDLERQKACLHAWNVLQNDLHQLHQLCVDFNKLIYEQKESVDRIENFVIESEENVRGGHKYLEKASRLKVAAYPIAGALIGTCIGGPVGLIAGLKLGGLTAFGGGILGFTGATLLKKRLESARNPENETRQIWDEKSQQTLLEEQKKNF